MATRLYNTRVAVELSNNNSTPEVIIKIDDNVLFCGILHGPTTVLGSYKLPTGTHNLSVEHVNKSPHDATTAVSIEGVTFNDISRPKFLYLGVYTPDYPEPWATQQREHGYTLDQQLSACDYLGWNGVWNLEFTVPIFTWIHRVDDLGWIYT